MPLPLTLYGAMDCDDTEHTRNRLRELGVPFYEVNIDHDAEAERFVLFINRGHSIPNTTQLNHKEVLT